LSLGRQGRVGAGPPHGPASPNGLPRADRVVGWAL